MIPLYFIGEIDMYWFYVIKFYPPFLSQVVYFIHWGLKRFSNSSEFSPINRIARSSAIARIMSSWMFGISLVYNRQSIGPKALPYGTHTLISFSSKYALSCLSLKVLLKVQQLRVLYWKCSFYFMNKDFVANFMKDLGYIQKYGRTDFSFQHFFYCIIFL